MAVLIAYVSLTLSVKILGWSLKAGHRLVLWKENAVLNIE